jgi:ADP-L-glycero-D-manno-heptose 6-epimerase
VLHAFRQIKEHGSMKLFRSHRPDFKDGEQMRDFVYVKDVTDVLYYLMHHRNPESNGIYNLGSGKAETFLSLTQSVFSALDMQPDISFVDTPEDIRDKYQYFTEADMSKLRRAGYKMPFHSLEEGIMDYVQEYLKEGKYL